MKKTGYFYEARYRYRLSRYSCARTLLKVEIHFLRNE